jgi:hypothetical protein
MSGKRVPQNYIPSSELNSSSDSRHSTKLTKHFKKSANRLTFLLMLGLFVVVSISLFPAASNSGDTLVQTTDSAQLKQSSTPNVATSSQTSVSASASTPPPANSSTSVSVNGQSVNVPNNGSTSETISNNGGKTTIELQQSSSGSGSSNTSVNLNVSSSQSTSTSSTEGGPTESQ